MIKGLAQRWSWIASTEHMTSQGGGASSVFKKGNKLAIKTWTQNKGYRLHYHKKTTTNVGACGEVFEFGLHNLRSVWDTPLQPENTEVLNQVILSEDATDEGQQ